MKTLGFRSLLSPFASLFRRPLAPEASWSMFFCEPLILTVLHMGFLFHHTSPCKFIRNDDDQLQRELTWAARRPSSSWAHDTDVLPQVSDTDAFEASLTECELRFLKGYESKCAGGICSLNQNPDVTCMSSNTQVLCPASCQVCLASKILECSSAVFA